jgi:hypothetical protein
MKLSEAEQKTIARLRRQQQFMIRWRWVGLLGIILNLAAGTYGFILLENFPRNPDPPYLLAAVIIIPIIFFTIGIGCFALVHILWNWNGKPETCLLLRLIDESQKSNGDIPADKK